MKLFAMLIHLFKIRYTEVFEKLAIPISDTVFVILSMQIEFIFGIIPEC